MEVTFDEPTPVKKTYKKGKRLLVSYLLGLAMASVIALIIHKKYCDYTPAATSETVIVEDTARVNELLTKIIFLEEVISEDGIYQAALERNFHLALEKLEKNETFIINLNDKRCNCELIHQEDADRQVKIYTIRCDSTEKKVFKFFTRNSTEQ